MSSGGPAFLGSTPADRVVDMSPVKHQPGGVGAGGDGEDKDVMSSSPPPMDGPGASPSKRISSSALRFTGGMKREHDLHTVNGLGSLAPDYRTSGLENDYHDQEGDDDDDDNDGDMAGELGGDFDLARGFQPIGSFNSSSSQPRQLGTQQGPSQRLGQGSGHQHQESHVRSGGNAAAARATS